MKKRRKPIDRNSKEYLRPQFDASVRRVEKAANQFPDERPSMSFIEFINRRFTRVL